MKIETEWDTLTLEALEKDIKEHPFNPRYEVSLDAKRIIRHMWIILVVLPFVLGILFEIVKSL